ncbi:MAG TPA: PfkB family carbohydrate kinase [Vicinamibacterales bacterium]|nr:PfkB family carbohydrate kinase [Vicinamibacterales bacterium]
MLLPAVTSDQIRRITARFTGAHVLVVGDAMLDKFIVGRVTRISPEAPVPVVAFDHEMHRIGGAANVAHNIASLGGQTTLVAATGHDDAATRLTAACRDAGITPALVGDSTRPTTTKVRVVTDRNQQVARIDYESDAEIAGDVEQRIITEIHKHAPRAQAIVISDYLKGGVTRAVAEAIVNTAGRDVPVLVDPKIPHIEHYASTTVVTPNHLETEIATHRRVRSREEARDAARVFRERARCRNVLMTRGDQGMWLLGTDVEGYLPSVAREVADVTGAGDTVIATLALALAAGASLAEAARLANEAAGIVVGKFGPATVTVDELLHAFDSTATL